MRYSAVRATVHQPKPQKRITRVTDGNICFLLHLLQVFTEFEIAHVCMIVANHAHDLHDVGASAAKKHCCQSRNLNSGKCKLVSAALHAEDGFWFMENNSNMLFSHVSRDSAIRHKTQARSSSFHVSVLYRDRHTPLLSSRWIMGVLGAYAKGTSLFSSGQFGFAA